MTSLRRKIQSVGHSRCSTLHSHSRPSPSNTNLTSLRRKIQSVGHSRCSTLHSHSRPFPSNTNPTSLRRKIQSVGHSRCSTLHSHSRPASNTNLTSLRSHSKIIAQIMYVYLGVFVCMYLYGFSISSQLT